MPATRARAHRAAKEGALLAFVRATTDLRARMVAEHGEDVGGRAWRDALELYTWRTARATGGAS